MNNQTLTYVVVNEQNEYVSQEFRSEDEAVNYALYLMAHGAGDHAVVRFEYECVDNSLAWTPGGSDQWPPQAASFRAVQHNGQTLFLCPTDLCTHLFEGRDLMPGGFTVTCPECGNMLLVPRGFRETA